MYAVFFSAPEPGPRRGGEVVPVVVGIVDRVIDRVGKHKDNHQNTEHGAHRAENNPGNGHSSAALHLSGNTQHEGEDAEHHIQKRKAEQHQRKDTEDQRRNAHSINRLLRGRRRIIRRIERLIICGGGIAGLERISRLLRIRPGRRLYRIRGRRRGIRPLLGDGTLRRNSTLRSKAGRRRSRTRIGSVRRPYRRGLLILRRLLCIHIPYRPVGKRRRAGGGRSLGGRIAGRRRFREFRRRCSVGEKFVAVRFGRSRGGFFHRFVFCRVVLFFLGRGPEVELIRHSNLHSFKKSYENPVA